MVTVDVTVDVLVILKFYGHSLTSHLIDALSTLISRVFRSCIATRNDIFPVGVLARHRVIFVLIYIFNLFVVSQLFLDQKDSGKYSQVM